MSRPMQEFEYSQPLNSSSPYADFDSEAAEGNFHGELTNQDYSTAAARDHYEKIAAMRQNAQAPDPFEGATPDQIKAAFEIAVRDEEQKAVDLQQSNAAKVFVAAHPEYVLNPRNAQLMELWALEQNDSGTTVATLERVYEHLRELGLLDIDAAKDQARQNNEIQSQADEYRQAKRASGISSRSNAVTRIRPQFTQEQLEQMPYQKLAELARNAERES